MALEQGPDVHVMVPLRPADGEVAERLRADVDAWGDKAAGLLRGECSTVPADVAHRPSPPPLGAT